MRKDHEHRITIRRSEERGQAHHGWLESFHTFSFGDYYDPKHAGFRSLRVINDDTVAAGTGFGTHPHKDMEIISYVIDGALEHEDSMGNSSVIKQGHVQRITAGRGISHSEFNHSKDDSVHFLQIWIRPDQKDLEPSYAEVALKDLQIQEGLRLICSKDGERDSILINQDAFVFFGELMEDDRVTYRTDDARGLWIHLISGELKILSYTLKAGDAISIEKLGEVAIDASQQSEFLLFDLK